MYDKLLENLEDVLTLNVREQKGISARLEDTKETSEDYKHMVSRLQELQASWNEAYKAYREIQIAGRSKISRAFNRFVDKMYETDWSNIIAMAIRTYGLIVAIKVVATLERSEDPITMRTKGTTFWSKFI